MFLPKLYQEVEHLIVVFTTPQSVLFIKVTAEMRDDIMVWVGFLETYNCHTPFPSAVWSPNEALNLFTDSCGSCGGGAFLIIIGQS
jgi:hypothetical protein